jgi:ferrous iron transport protein A
MDSPVSLSTPQAVSWPLPVDDDQAPADPVIALHQGPLHTPGVLQAFAPARDEDSRKTLRRMAEIGFLPGESVRVVSRGWLRGGPIAVRVGQSTFALRAHEAALLQVRWAVKA